MTDDEIAAIEARAKEVADDLAELTPPPDVGRYYAKFDPRGRYHKWDGVFVAHAKADVLALVAEVRKNRIVLTDFSEQPCNCMDGGCWHRGFCAGCLQRVDEPHADICPLAILLQLPTESRLKPDGGKTHD